MENKRLGGCWAPIRLLADERTPLCRLTKEKRAGINASNSNSYCQHDTL